MMYLRNIGRIICAIEAKVGLQVRTIVLLPEIFISGQVFLELLARLRVLLLGVMLEGTIVACSFFVATFTLSFESHRAIG